MSLWSAILRFIRRRTVSASLVTILLASILLSCSQPNSILSASEKEYNVGIHPIWRTNLRAYHSALLDPSGIHLDSDGYVIGAEKIRIDDGDTGPHRVTHIIRYVQDSSGQAGAIPAPPTPCGVFSMLLGPGTQQDDQVEPMQWCHDRSSTTKYLEAFGDDLGKQLAKRHYSHILFMVMGWNTDQQEAVKNYNELTNNLRLASFRAPGAAVFDPLVIGLSWPSQWSLGDGSAIPSNVVKAASFFIKKDQADMVGRQLLSQIVTKVVLPARAKLARSQQLPLIMIGHSFGARALAAMFPDWKSALYNKTPWDTWKYDAPALAEFTFDDADRLILLEGAFDIDRLFTNRHELLPAIGKTKLNVTMTSSAVDSAFDFAILGNYVGDIRTFESVCGQQHGLIPSESVAAFSCGRAQRRGSWGLELCNQDSDPVADISAPTTGKIHYYDASMLINCQTPFGGGGAHDDFYRPEMGRFLWNEIAGVSH